VRFEGTQTIQATREQVWAFIMDPNKVGPCAPGFQRAEITDAEHFKAYVAVGIAAIRATFALDVQLTDLDEPNTATAKAHGVAPASAVDITGVMNLSDAGNDATTMQWSADVVVSGTLASLGARLMQSTAQKLTAQFFECFKEHLEAPTAAPSASSAQPVTGNSVGAAPSPGWLRRLLQRLRPARGGSTQNRA
jgi:carbon monoxide dehydrogenase subunit G